MEAKDVTANSSLGILDLADSKLVDCLTDMESADCSTRFKKTIERLHRTCNEKLADLTADFELDVSKIHFGNGGIAATEGEDVETSRLDSIFLKPCIDLTPSKDTTDFSTYQSTPKERSQQNLSTSLRARNIPSFGRKSVAVESELSSIPRDTFTSYKSGLHTDKEVTSRKESKPQERSIENGRKALAAEHDSAEVFRNKIGGRSFSQETFHELRKKFELDSNGSSDGGSSGSTLKQLKSPPVRRTLSLDDGNPFELEWRNSGFSGLSFNSGMFKKGADAINAIDEDEEVFLEQNRFEISRVSDISTIPPDFSHVSDPASGDYFYARSEKVGRLTQREDAERPSLGLQIVSPPNNALGQDISRLEPEESLFGERKTDQSRQPVTSTATASTLKCMLRESSIHLDSTSTRSKTVEEQSTRPQSAEPPSIESGYQSSQQPLHVYVPAQDRVSPCFYSGSAGFQYPPAHPWGDQGPCSCPPFYQNSVYRGSYPNLPRVYNQPAMAQEFFKVVVQAVLPEQLVCVHDVKEVDLVLHNPSYQNFRCHVRVMHVTVLDTAAMKLDVMANSDFVMPGTVEVRGGTTHHLKMKCSFKLPGKYRVHLEIISESLHSAASSSSSAFTVEVEEPNVEMSSATDGGNCIDFGRILANSPSVPQSIRLVNKSRASVPVKISISSMCDVSQKFLFPPELLRHLVASTSHTWLDVLLTLIVVRLDGKSTLDIPVTVDTNYQPIISQENFVASVQLSLKGNVYRTKHLMKICATLCSSLPAARSTAQVQPPVPIVFPRRIDELMDEGRRLSEHKISFLASRKRSIYFPGIQVGQSLEKTLTLMNKSHDMKLMAQLILISTSPQQQYFIREGENEFSRLQNIIFEPQQKRDFPIVFRPTAVASSSCSLQVKACTATRRMDKQDFLVPICGYGGASQITMIRPNPSSSRKAHLLVNPLTKGHSEHIVRLRNSGSRAAFVAVLPLKDGQIELDDQVTVSSQAFVISPGETTDIKVTVTFSSFNSSIFMFSQYLSFLHGDEQLRKILKNKISSCDTSDRRLYEGPGLMKALDILQPFEGEDTVPRDELYKEFKKEVAEVFYETIKVYDVVLSTNVDVSDDQDDSFFTISNLACSYGSLLNSTVFNRDTNEALYSLSPPMRDLQKKKM